MPSGTPVAPASAPHRHDRFSDSTRSPLATDTAGDLLDRDERPGRV